MKKAILKVKSITIKEWIVFFVTIAVIIFIHLSTPLQHR